MVCKMLKTAPLPPEPVTYVLHDGDRCEFQCKGPNRDALQIRGKGRELKAEVVMDSHQLTILLANLLEYFTGEGVKDGEPVTIMLGLD